LKFELYAIVNKEGKYFRKIGHCSYEPHWIDRIEDARLYGRKSSAKTQITYWANKFPEHGVPSMVIIDANVKKII